MLLFFLLIVVLHDLSQKFMNKRIPLPHKHLMIQHKSCSKWPGKWAYEIT